jgi:hypothetical protein
MVVSQMKKTSPSFTFEVKRSKLSSQQPSRFERFVSEPKQKLSVPKRHTSHQGSADASKTEAPVVERRILESLPLTPAVPSVAVPAAPQIEDPAQEVTAPVIKRRRKAAAASLAPFIEAKEAQAMLAVEGDVGPATSAVVVPLPIFKAKRKAAGSAEQLPRGERWKRRLPRAAW